MTGILLAAVLAVIPQLPAELAREFSDPPDAAKPWCYWWWLNGHADRASITADLESMKRLGFGGLLMFDSRGYWDDDDHLVIPKAKVEFMSEEWQDLVEFSIREAARLGLKYSMNMSPSGGKLDGPWAVGADAPKRHVYRFCRMGDKVEPTGLAHYRDICTMEVHYRGPEVTFDGGWHNGGDGIRTMKASVEGRQDAEADRAERILASADDGEAKSVIVRFGYAMLPGHDYDVDVLDQKAIAGHFERFQGTFQKRIPGLVGRDRTLVALYSCSWEGPMPTWTGDFEREFRQRTGRVLRPLLPLLAGFKSPDAEANARFASEYRRVRNDLFKDNFYGTMRDMAHERNLDWYSESGGPWRRDPELFGEADQLEFLSVNDYPQGEFWPLRSKVLAPDGGRANANARMHIRGAVDAAHIYGRRIVSAEAFSHMHHHWSVDPAFLKPTGDMAFADGINRLVWHTFTLSPPEFGMPGAEYFAGSHINRNVTWQGEAGPFIRYLGRCQSLLQRGEPVTDIAVLGGNRTYVGRWGRFRRETADVETEGHLHALVPDGFACDLVNDDALTRDPGLLARYRVVYDVRRPENRGRMIPVNGLKPDVEDAGTATWCHRRTEAADIYFIAGEGAYAPIFRTVAPSVELWDAVTGSRRPAQAERTLDGRTRVVFDLPRGGSVFVMFLPEPTATPVMPSAAPFERAVEGPWNVSFAYPPNIAAEPPKPMPFAELQDFTTVSELRYFSGTASYRAIFDLEPDEVSDGCVKLSTGELPSGLAKVIVNGRDCGTAWCAPWEVEVTSAVKAGRNELEIRVVNNWSNRLIGDCLLPPERRVTTSNLHYWPVRKMDDENDAWTYHPTVFSGYAPQDRLQSSGLLGPVRLSRR